MAGGLFVGLATLDLLYLVDALPQANQKIVAQDSAIAAGGPAANAAVTFAHLGNSAKLLAAIGTHAIANLIRTDLEQSNVSVIDLTAERGDPPPASSILVTQATGDRAVVSLNAVRRQVSAANLSLDWFDGVDVVLLDGHQMELSGAIAQAARKRSIPVVLDGGSWKSGFEQVLSHVDYAICSANFQPPNCRTPAEVFSYLDAQGISHLAVTRGHESIWWRHQDHFGEIAVPAIEAVDTLGAGDVFHGAFCHFILQGNFQQALAEAAIVAARSCTFFGTRRWMDVTG